MNIFIPITKTITVFKDRLVLQTFNVLRTFADFKAFKTVIPNRKNMWRCRQIFLINYKYHYLLDHYYFNRGNFLSQIETIFCA